MKRSTRRALPAVLLLLGTLALVRACGDDAETATGAFGDACRADADCSAGRCFTYSQKGKRCTLDCPPDPGDCPNDGAGCNGKGVCKVK